MGWVLQAIDSLLAESSSSPTPAAGDAAPAAAGSGGGAGIQAPPLAIMPVGTGNGELLRCLVLSRFDPKDRCMHSPV